MGSRYFAGLKQRPFFRGLLAPSSFLGQYVGPILSLAGTVLEVDLWSALDETSFS